MDDSNTESVRFTRKQIGLLLALLALLAAVWIGWQWWQGQQIKQEVASDASATLTSPAAAAAYQTLGGEPFDFAEVRGNVRVVTLWATWSPFSKDDFTTLSDLSVRYTDEPVRFIALNRAEQAARAEAYLSRYELAANVEVVLDTTDHLYQELDGFAMPETVVYDQRGTLVQRYRGPLAGDDVITLIDELLQETEE